MLIKIILASDNEYTKDLGTAYIKTLNNDFIKAVEKITDFKVMSAFLDENKNCFEELIFPRPRFDYDMVVDVSKSYIDLINDYSMNIEDKFSYNDIAIPNVVYTQNRDTVFDNEKIKKLITKIPESEPEEKIRTNELAKMSYISNKKRTMKTFVLGDTHGKIDIKKLNRWYQKEHQNLTKDDIVIQLGDWGALWHYQHDEIRFRKDVELQIKWARKNFTTAVIPGNHENYDLIKKLPVIEKWGGKVRELKPINYYNRRKDYGRIYLLERGETYTINGKTFLALGGATSQDKAMRIRNESWWEDETWNIEEESNCLDNLDKVNWEVDYVIAHTCPESIGRVLLSKMASLNGDYYSKSGKINDSVVNFFTYLVEKGLKFKEWHFGHWHMDVVIDDFKDVDGNYLYQCHYLNEPKLISG